MYLIDISVSLITFTGLFLLNLNSSLSEISSSAVKYSSSETDAIDEISSSAGVTAGRYSGSVLILLKKFVVAQNKKLPKIDP